MKKAKLALSAMVVVMLAGCGQQDGNAAARASKAAVGAQPAVEHQKDQGMTALKPPSPDSILYLIYQRDGDGAFTYEVDGGVIVSYWYGLAFDLKGKHYFTGFTTGTEGEEGPGSEGGMEEPGHVAIGQATFVQGGDAAKPTWSQLETDGYVGEFGANDQGDPVDTTRKAQYEATEDGRLVLAVPTRRFADGVATASFALFLFDPDNVDALSFRRWGYLGSIAAGSDNSAACDEGQVMPCAVSTGTLAFGPPSASGLPVLTVALAGKEIAGPGKLRELGPTDGLTYTFNAKAGRYQP
ncbi:hypothetical protein [Stenotrophomonas sp.]|uniref:hypothetical protein n=1 Tax=Stenotrophomonas sp. TaxID=69392 RepID=UPI002FC6B4A9